MFGGTETGGCTSSRVGTLKTGHGTFLRARVCPLAHRESLRPDINIQAPLALAGKLAHQIFASSLAVPGGEIARENRTIGIFEYLPISLERTLNFLTRNFESGMLKNKYAIIVTDSLTGTDVELRSLFRSNILAITGERRGVSRDYGKFRFYRRKARSNLEVGTGVRGSLN